MIFFSFNMGNSKRLVLVAVALSVVTASVLMAQGERRRKEFSSPAKSAFEGVPLFNQSRVLTSTRLLDAGRVHEGYQFISRSAPQMVFELYRSHFSQKGWKMLKEANPRVPSQIILRAQKGVNEAKVVIDSVVASPRTPDVKETIVSLDVFYAE